MRFLVIPCFNEEHRLVEVEVTKCVDALNCVVVLVDDGSTDQTLAKLTELSLRFPKSIEVIAIPTNVGKGEAVRAGFIYSFERGATEVLFCDADFSTGQKDLLRMCNTLNEHPECHAVIGSRVAIAGSNIQRSNFRHYSGRVFATLVSLVLHHRIYDTQCGAKIFRVNDKVKQAFSKKFISPWAFDVEVIGRLLRISDSREKPCVVLELPLLYWADVPGSKLDSKSRIQTVFQLFRISLSLREWS